MAVRPLIGITTSEVRPLTYANPTPEGEPFRAEMALGITYVNAIERAGGAPVVLPPLPLEVVGSLVAHLDGICFSGGPDIDPAEYGAEVDPRLGPTWRRLDRFELEVARQADGARVPVLGICRGAQVLNVARGGDLVQHLTGEEGESPLHHRQRIPGERQAHTVAIAPGSVLERAVGVTELDVNSFHHQAVRTLGRGLTAVARAPDGVVEAVEDPEALLYLGVQWHAEFDVERATGMALLRALVDAAVSAGVSGVDGRR